MTALRNVWAIVEKEWRHYFGSPIAYVALMVWTLLFGIFFYFAFSLFLRQSMMAAQQMEFGGGPKMSLNEWLIRPVLHNMAVVALFLAPMLTMRLFAEEKRQGTIELLATSPLTSMQIILGKFLGAMGLFTAMLALSLIHIGVVFWRGNPEPLPILTTYLGLLLMGGCFVSLGLLISSLTRNQIVAGMATFGVFLMLWVINWIASFTGPTTQAVLNYLSITDHLDDFTRGIIDTKHLVYYISFIAFGLFLTARSVDSERWRG